MDRRNILVAEESKETRAQRELEYHRQKNKTKKWNRKQSKKWKMRNLRREQWEANSRRDVQITNRRNARYAVGQEDNRPRRQPTNNQRHAHANARYAGGRYKKRGGGKKATYVRNVRAQNAQNANSGQEWVAQQRAELATWEQELSKSQAKVDEERTDLLAWREQLTAESEGGQADPLLEMKRAAAIKRLRADLRRRMGSRCGSCGAVWGDADEDGIDDAASSSDASTAATTLSSDDESDGADSSSTDRTSLSSLSSPSQ